MTPVSVAVAGYKDQTIGITIAASDGKVYQFSIPRIMARRLCSDLDKAVAESSKQELTHDFVTANKT